jgi:3-methyladenine DNA glycosylase AlkD
MTHEQAMAALEAAGTEQTRKTWSRHGITGPMFGVLYSVLGSLQKQIRTDHALAGSLWKSGNHDARVLATMIADPKQCDATLLRRWLRDCGNSVLTDAIAKLASASPDALALARAWRDDAADPIASAGWSVTAACALHGNDLSDDDCLALIEQIETTIHGRPNRTRYAMNNALIAIGGGRASLRARALQAAKGIGVVAVDHGQTNCQTPDAAAYIQKMAARATRPKAAKKPRR